MYLKGASIQGFTYGDLSPLDYAGLKCWSRSTDGLTFSRGTSVSAIKDISGNERHLTGGSGVTIVNTAYGLAFKGAGSGTPTTFINNSDFASFLQNGSPYSFFLIANSTSSSTTGSNYIGANISLSNPWRLSPGASQLVRVAANTPNTTIALGASNVNYILSDVSYGYGYGAGTLKSYINNVLKSTASYSANPGSFTSSRFSIGFLSPHLTYEWFAYDNTGKTIEQIDFERNALYELYLKKRYKNFVS